MCMRECVSYIERVLFVSARACACVCVSVRACDIQPKNSCNSHSLYISTMIYLRWYKMWRFIFALSLVLSIDLSLVNHVNGDADVVEVDIESGRIRGKRSLTLFREKPYYSFRGIPFAQPPIKDLRFKVSERRTTPPKRRNNEIT